MLTGTSRERVVGTSRERVLPLFFSRILADDVCFAYNKQDVNLEIEIWTQHKNSSKCHECQFWES